MGDGSLMPLGILGAPEDPTESYPTQKAEELGY